MEPRKRRKGIAMGKRKSTRLIIQEKLKIRRENPPPVQLASDYDSAVDVVVGNPADQALFLSFLGLIPSDTNLSDVEQANDSIVQTYNGTSSSSSNKTVENDTMSSSDSTDLDLEVVFCPLDIPEIYKEITGKPQKVFNNNHNRVSTRESSLTPLRSGSHRSYTTSSNSCSSSESGYDSPSGSEGTSLSPVLPVWSTYVNHLTPISPQHDDGGDECVIIYDTSEQIPGKSTTDGNDDCILIYENSPPSSQGMKRSLSVEELYSFNNKRSKLEDCGFKINSVAQTRQTYCPEPYILIEDPNSVEVIREKLCLLNT